MKRYLFIFIVLFYSLTQIAFAESVTVRWDPPTTNNDGSTLTDLVGFNVFYGTESGVYTNNASTDLNYCIVINNLTPGQTYYFVATAYNVAGTESVYSDQVSKTISVNDVGDCNNYVDTWVEAEYCTRNIPMYLGAEESISYVYTNTEDQGSFSCKFIIPSNGIYYMNANVKAVDGGHNSFYVSTSGITTNNADSWHIFWETQGRPDFAEDFVNRAGTWEFGYPDSDPREFNLTEGTATITFTGREMSTKLDKVMLVSTGGCVPAKVIFINQPSGGFISANWIQQPMIEVQNSENTVCVDAANAVSLAIDSNPNSGVLSCTVNPLSAISGVSAFNGCDINKAGIGYTLIATASGLTGIISSTFNISNIASRGQVSRTLFSKQQIERTQVVR